eukprot:Skav235040  [mRNA]  locus=scaffold287:261784:267003:- [translate_table: standard]
MRTRSSSCPWLQTVPKVTCAYEGVSDRSLEQGDAAFHPERACSQHFESAKPVREQPQHEGSRQTDPRKALLRCATMSMQSNQSKPSRLFRWLTILTLWTCIRVGEASHPGPNQTMQSYVIGCANSTGLLGKAHVASRLPGMHEHTGLWGFSETHLTKRGCEQFQRDLHFATQGKASLLAGHPADYLSQNTGSIGGDSKGVGFMASFPGRPLTHDWEEGIFESARLQVAAYQICNIWCKCGLAYGFAFNSHTAKTKKQTNTLLASLSTRIVLQSSGPRCILGDWNLTSEDAEYATFWKEQGFFDVQSFAKWKWGREIQPTYRQKSVIDHIWLSREFAPWIQDVCIDNTWFADHAILFVRLQMPRTRRPAEIWIKPHALPWEDVPETNECPLPGVEGLDVDQTYRTLMHSLEEHVDTALRQTGQPGLVPSQRGRACTTECKMVHSPAPPLKRSKNQDPVVGFVGENWQHFHWFRQLRRLTHLQRLLHSTKCSVRIKEVKALWQSIIAAKGFGGGFRHYWFHRASQHVGCIRVLPKHCPTADEVTGIVLNFQKELKSLESSLNQHRSTQAKTSRMADPTKIFQDLKAPRPLPVQTLILHTHTEAVDIDDRTITIAPNTLTPGEPVMKDHHVGMRQDPGPCAVLLQRLHSIAWAWHGEGWVTDHDGIQLNLHDSPIQLLKQRLQQAWQAMVATELSTTRSSFAGLQHVDPSFTMEDFEDYSLEDQALLRVVLNGSFYTRDNLVHSGKVETKQCPWCPCIDSVAHRHWSCPFMSEVWGSVETGLADRVQSMEACTSMHGWFPQLTGTKQWLRSLAALPDRTWEWEVHSHLPHVLHLFTDGSAMYPSQPRIRLASWAFVVANLETDEFLPVARGLVHGVLQTVLRGEILAALSALRFIIAKDRDGVLWADNALVVQRIAMYQSGEPPPSNLEPNHDLWAELYEAVHLVGRHLIKCVKVPSHENVDNYTDIIDRWALRGNAAADREATVARNDMPSELFHLWNALVDEHQRQVHDKMQLHKHFLAVGKKAVMKGSTAPSAPNDNGETDEEAQEFSLVPDAPPDDAAIPHVFYPLPEWEMRNDSIALGPCGSEVFQWLHTLVNQDDSVTSWVSMYQLLISYQLHVGCWGPAKQGKFWIRSEEFWPQAFSYNFLKQSKFFTQYLKHLGRSFGLVITGSFRRPTCSELIPVWCRCYKMKISRGMMVQVDECLKRFKSTPFTKMKRDFAMFPVAYDL